MSFSFLDLIWIFLILMTFLPGLRQYRRERLRAQVMLTLQRRRGSQLIALIHRQESLSLLGMFTRRYINIEDSEQILRAIRLTPPDVPIDLVLHTPGGLVLAAEQIARALLSHPARVEVFVPHYAMSGGTLIALAADAIHMDANAVLGPVDPQLGNYPAVSILRAVERKEPNDVDDETLILADVAAKAVRQVHEVVVELLKGRLDEDAVDRVATTLTDGRWTHDYPITCEQLTELGLNVHCELPGAIYALMELYPQAASRRPSVQYIPVPYRRRSPTE